MREGEWLSTFPLQQKQKICKLAHSNGFCHRQTPTIPVAKIGPTYVENWTSKFRRRFTRHLDVHSTFIRRPNSTSKGPIWTFYKRLNNVAVLAGDMITLHCCEHLL